MTEKYDKIGFNYNHTRKTDPYLAQRLFNLLTPIPEGHYLDIGCGTGNYTIALHQQGVQFTAVDPSIKMLETARRKCNTINWVQAKAEQLPFAPDSFTGIMASLTIHHWDDLELGFRELCRVVKPNGKLVLFTATPKQMQGYWLNHYFPQMLKDSMVQMPEFSAVQMAMERADFEIVKTEKYFIKDDLQDLFLYAGKNRPTLYLNEAVRNGISSFSALATQAEVQAGLVALQKDLDNGEIENIMKQYENKAGDYLYLVGEKKR